LIRIEPLQWIPRGEPFRPAGDADAADNGFPPILQHLVRQRGLPTGADLESFLHPRLKDLEDPFLIPGMSEAVERLLHAIDQGESICIYGDYDVDGIASITILEKVLRAYGVEARRFIPRRGDEGYGLSEAAIARCLREGPAPGLLVAVDCGTVSVDEVAMLKSAGVDVVIVDHHEPHPDQRPDCAALVNPKCGDRRFAYLCTAGVVFKLSHALLKTRMAGIDLKELIDLVALATITDIVPMLGENRLMVRHGLRQLPETINPGLRALQEVVGMNGRANPVDVGFRIGPRLNAAGRMDVPEDALALLTVECGDEARRLAEKLDAYNRERQGHEALIRREAMEMLAEGFDPVKDPVIVLGSRDWHHGVVGIVASRLMRQFHKPTFVIAIDEDGVGKGSGRSIEGLSLVDAIRECGDELIAGGGHAMAAGISIREERIDGFRRRFGEYVLRATTAEQRRPKLQYDSEISFDLLSLDFLADYELLQPFGNSNPQPIFVAREVEPSRAPYHMKNHHLRLTLRQGRHEHDAVFFGGGERLLPDPPWDLAFHIDRNTYRGRTSLQLIVIDLRAASSD
jgi:single-stranded-DNA-specific exonuclease